MSAGSLYDLLLFSRQTARRKEDSKRTDEKENVHSENGPPQSPLTLSEDTFAMPIPCVAYITHEVLVALSFLHGISRIHR
jgi:hypothetical protein